MSCFPGQVLFFPGQVLYFPDQVLYFPGQVLCFPEWIHIKGCPKYHNLNVNYKVDELMKGADTASMSDFVRSKTKKSILVD